MSSEERKKEAKKAIQSFINVSKRKEKNLILNLSY